MKKIELLYWIDDSINPHKNLQIQNYKLGNMMGKNNFGSDVKTYAQIQDFLFFFYKCLTLFWFFKNKFIYYLCLAALGLRCCARAFSSCSERGLLLIAVRRLLNAVASLVAEHGL